MLLNLTEEEFSAKVYKGDQGTSITGNAEVGILVNGDARLEADERQCILDLTLDS